MDFVDTIIHGDCEQVLREFPDSVVHMATECSDRSHSAGYCRIASRRVHQIPPDLPDALGDSVTKVETSVQLQPRLLDDTADYAPEKAK